MHLMHRQRQPKPWSTDKPCTWLQCITQPKEKPFHVKYLSRIIPHSPIRTQVQAHKGLSFAYSAQTFTLPHPKLLVEQRQLQLPSATFAFFAAKIKPQIPHELAAASATASSSPQYPTSSCYANGKSPTPARSLYPPQITCHSSSRANPLAHGNSSPCQLPSPYPRDRQASRIISRRGAFL